MSGRRNRDLRRALRVTLYGAKPPTQSWVDYEGEHPIEQWRLRRARKLRRQHRLATNGTATLAMMKRAFAQTPHQRARDGAWRRPIFEKRRKDESIEKLTAALANKTQMLAGLTKGAPPRR